VIQRPERAGAGSPRPAPAGPPGAASPSASARSVDSAARRGSRSAIPAPISSSTALATRVMCSPRTKESRAASRSAAWAGPPSPAATL